MGNKESKSLTLLGLRYIYKYLLLHFSLILILLLVSTTFSLNQQNLLTLSASEFFFVIIVVLANIVIFIWFVIGLKNLLNGRMEFDDPHESNVILATILIIIYAILYFVNLFIAQGFTGGTAFIAGASNNFFSSISLQFYLIIIFSVVSDLLLGFSLFYLVKNLTTEDQIKRLKTSCVLLALGTFTVNITALVAFILFYKIYKEVYLNINLGKLKAAVVAPCPFCSSEIPIESQVCKFCGARFEKKVSNEPNIKIDFEAPEIKYKFERGNLPIQKITREGKIKLLYFIGFIILCIFIGLFLILII